MSVFMGKFFKIFPRRPGFCLLSGPVFSIISGVIGQAQHSPQQSTGESDVICNPKTGDRRQKSGKTFEVRSLEGDENRRRNLWNLFVQKKKRKVGVV